MGAFGSSETRIGMGLPGGLGMTCQGALNDRSALGL